MLYDKKQKEWLNVATKSSQWNRVGEQMEPPATGDQCKKHYENMRTRLGKILKNEKKSGLASLRGLSVMTRSCKLGVSSCNRSSVERQFPVSNLLPNSQLLR